MSTTKRLLKSIILEITDLEAALHRFDCRNVQSFLEDSHLKKIAAQTLIIISEAIQFLSDEYKSNHSEIDWKQFKTIVIQL